MIHQPGLECIGCKNKLVGVHIAMVEWFNWIKAKHPEIHCSWGYRGEKDQHADFLSGRSKLDYPHSAHNHMLNGSACSLAIDLFTIDENGMAHFDGKFYGLIARETRDAGYKIIWGGAWKTFKDLDHYQLDDL